MSTKPAEDTRPLNLHQTVALFEQPDWIDQIEVNLEDMLADDSDEKRMEAYIGEELDRLFGPDTGPDAEKISQITNWVANLEQASENEHALSFPHRAEFERHQHRRKMYDRRAKRLREYIAIKLIDDHGGRFSDGQHRLHVRAVTAVEVLGTCENPAHVFEKRMKPHFEEELCKNFLPVSDVPPHMLKVKITVDKVAVGGMLREIMKKQEELRAKGVPEEEVPVVPAWGRIRKLRSTLVIK